MFTGFLTALTNDGAVLPGPLAPDLMSLTKIIHCIASAINSPAYLYLDQLTILLAPPKSRVSRRTSYFQAKPFKFLPVKVFLILLTLSNLCLRFESTRVAA